MYIEKDLETIIIECQNSSSLELEEKKSKFLEILIGVIQLDDKDFLKIFEILVKWIDFFRNQKVDNPFLLSSLLLKWSNDDDFEGVIGDLAANLVCSNENLRYIVDVLEDEISIVGILDVHIRTRYGTCMVFSLVCERLLKAFGRTNLEEYEWEHLIETVEEVKNCFEYDPKFLSRQKYSVTRDNRDVLVYIESKQKELSHNILAKVPKWVSLKEGETEHCYKDKFLGNVSEKDEEELEKIKEFLEANTKYKILKEKESLEKENPESSDSLDSDIPFAETNPNEVAEVFIALKENSNEYPEDGFPVERFYGPVNAILGRECCLLNSPCRMFYCVCREIDEYEDVESNNLSNDPQEWFLGKCQECERKIEKFRHTIRFPIDGGGWLGCFCGFPCMIKSRIRPIYDNDDLRLKEISKILHRFGVTDL